MPTVTANLKLPWFRIAMATAVGVKNRKVRRLIKSKLVKLEQKAMIDACLSGEIKLRKHLFATGVTSARLFFHPKKFKGNSGFLLASLGNPKTFYSSGVGASRSLKKMIDRSRLSGVPTNSRCATSGQWWFRETPNPISNPVYQAQLGREHDSEYILLNNFAAIFSKTQVNSGRVVLFTERLPCLSCEQVIYQFCHDYNSIDFVIVFWGLGANQESDVRRINDSIKSIRPTNELMKISSIYYR